MGLKITIPGVSFTDTSLPKLYPDPIMSGGSLALFDAAHPAGWSNGTDAPEHGDILNNIAWEQAAGIIGSGTLASLSSAFDINFTDPDLDGRVELTAKKGIHGIVSQTSPNGQKRLRLPWPSAILAYVEANKVSRSFYLSMWARVTRATVGSILSAQGGFQAGGSPSGNYLIEVRNTFSAMTPAPGGVGLGNRVVNGGTSAPSFVSGGVAGMTGTGALSSTVSSAMKIGPGDGFASFENDKAASIIFYKVYLEDLTESGRTYAEVDALDHALWAEAFAVGGRFYDDSWTAPSVVP